MSIITCTRPAVKPIAEDLVPDSPDRREPFTQSDLDWAAYHLNANCTDYDVEVDPFEDLTEEYHRWLDSLAPTEGELEARDRGDAFLGHD
jgi:hypothetical protein